MNEEQREDDIFEGTDEEGNKLLLRIIRYFFYNGEEYVLLGEDHDSSCECCEHQGERKNMTMYVMRVQQSVNDEGEEIEEFIPVDESMMDTLIEVVQTDFGSGDEEEIDEPDANE